MSFINGNKLCVLSSGTKLQLYLQINNLKKTQIVAKCNVVQENGTLKKSDSKIEKVNLCSIFET
jgi:hypothetical protein